MICTPFFLSSRPTWRYLATAIYKQKGLPNGKPFLWFVSIRLLIIIVFEPEGLP